jgi:signal transduction histidine kinase
LLIAAVAIIIRQHRTAKTLFYKLNKLFDDAANGDATDLRYDESVLSALGDKLLRAIHTNKEQLAELTKDRNKLKSLVSDISHQTKTPVTNILLYAGLLSENGNLDAKSRQMAMGIMEQADKLKFLTQALVKMSRLETGVMQIESMPQSVIPLISAAVSDVYAKATEKAIDLTIDADEHLTAVFDMKWTKEAVFNVLDNAVKYTKQGGKISISAVEYEMFARLDITDNGVGISKEEHADIWKRFYRSPHTREQDGIGVGLYLAREIIVLQGGYMKVSSEPHKGSTFSIYLPKS